MRCFNLLKAPEAWSLSNETCISLYVHSSPAWTWLLYLDPASSFLQTYLKSKPTTETIWNVQNAGQIRVLHNVEREGERKSVGVVVSQPPEARSPCTILDLSSLPSLRFFLLYRHGICNVAIVNLCGLISRQHEDWQETGPDTISYSKTVNPLHFAANSHWDKLAWMEVVWWLLWISKFFSFKKKLPSISHSPAYWQCICLPSLGSLTAENSF